MSLGSPFQKSFYYTKGKYLLLLEVSVDLDIKGKYRVFQVFESPASFTPATQNNTDFRICRPNLLELLN